MQDSLKPIELCFASINANYKHLAKALVLPIIAYLTIVAFMLAEGTSITALWVLRFATLIPVTLIAVTTHRIILKGPDSVPTWGINRFGWREIKFTLSQYLVLIFLIPIYILFFIPYVGFLLGSVASAYFLGRMSLVFPSIAIENKFDFKDSWDATKNHKLMMFIVVAVFPFVLGMIGFMLGRIEGAAIVIHVITIITTVYIIAALSIAYQIVIEPEGVR